MSAEQDQLNRLRNSAALKIAQIFELAINPTDQCFTTPIIVPKEISGRMSRAMSHSQAMHLQGELLGIACSYNGRFCDTQSTLYANAIEGKAIIQIAAPGKGIHLNCDLQVLANNQAVIRPCADDFLTILVNEDTSQGPLFTPSQEMVDFARTQGNWNEADKLGVLLAVLSITKQSTTNLD